MDISYIILNTIIYGCCALLLADFYLYWKILNFALWSYIMFSWYMIFHYINDWITLQNILVLLVFLVSFFLVNYLLLNKFKNAKKRWHASLIITLWLSFFLDNFCGYLYWWSGISLPTKQISTPTLIVIFLVLFFAFFYFHRASYYSKIFKAISENEKIVSGLWIKKNNFIQILFWLWLLILVILSYVLLITSSIKMQSWLFYIIKWMWIMILVWLSKKERMFLWALIYVIFEYILFNKLWLPLSYKEILVLSCIMLVLLFKPEWLFNLKKRNI